MHRILKKVVAPAATFVLTASLSAAALVATDVLPASAWDTTEPQVAAVCVDGEAVIQGSIVNLETDLPANSMDITMNTPYGSDGPKTVAPGNPGNFLVHTGETSISGGKADFDLKWTDGHSGDDTVSAYYVGTGDCPQPPPPECPEGQVGTPPNDCHVPPVECEHSSNFPPKPGCPPEPPVTPPTQVDIGTALVVVAQPPTPVVAVTPQFTG
jgi:hypothetical protein